MVTGGGVLVVVVKLSQPAKGLERQILWLG
jgi:hypothetical protein